MVAKGSAADAVGMEAGWRAHLLYRRQVPGPSKLDPLPGNQNGTLIL